MCSNYRPTARDRLQRINGRAPAFDYPEEDFPGLLGPFLSNAFPDKWLPGTFGLVPHWADPKLARHTYNARSETVAEKPSFRSAWRARQLAVIPMDCFYEPNYETGRAVRWRIARADGQPFGVAGLWERRVHDDGPTHWSFTMLTINADAHPLMRRFHKPGDEKRSVVVLDDDAWGDWLNSRTEADVRALLRPFDPDLLIAEAAPR